MKPPEQRIPIIPWAVTIAVVALLWMALPRMAG